MKKLLTLTIIAIIALIGLSVSVNAAEVTVDTEADLKDALLTDGTVKLTGDIEITESIRATTNVTVDLNGFKITGPDDGKANWYAFIVEGGTFTLKDTSEAQTGEIYAKCYGVETKAGTFVMENGKITATKNGGIGAAIVNYGGKVEIKGGTLLASNWALNAQAYFSDIEVVISGGSFETTSTEESAVQIGGEYSQEEEIVAISGGTFKGTNSFAVSSDASVSITGGTFSSDVDLYISEEVSWDYDEEGNMVIFTPIYLDEPTNLRWDGTKATWDAVPNAANYVVIVCDEHGQIAQDIVTEDTSVDLAEYLTDETKEYIFVVIADSDTVAYLASVGAESEAYVFPEEDNEDEEIKDDETTEKEPEEEEDDKKDDTPATGSIDTVLFVSAIVAVISVAGIALVKKYTR